MREQKSLKLRMFGLLRGNTSKQLKFWVNILYMIMNDNRGRSNTKGDIIVHENYYMTGIKPGDIPFY